MKKIGSIVFFMIGLGVLTLSCNKTKTYADHLKEERKAIDKFIGDNKLVVLDKLPADTVFKSNEFYRDPATGVYFNIVDRGNFKSKIKPGEEVYVRYSGLKYFANKKDTVSYSNMDPIRAPFPETLIYRGPVTMRNSLDLYSNTTPAWAVPLPYVGHTGKVRLIVPFNMGSSADRSNYRSINTTTYYDNVQYRFRSYAE